MKVFKYPFEIVDHPVIKMPVVAKPLRVLEQNGVPCLWALVDPDRNLIYHEFRLLGTGHPVESSVLGDHIDTFFMSDGLLVFHLFKLKL